MFARIRARIPEDSGPPDLHCLCDGDMDALWVAPGPSGPTLQVCPACHPRVHCTRCGGTGKDFRFDPVRRVEQVQDCECMSLDEACKRLGAAELPQRYLRANFDLRGTLPLVPPALRRRLWHLTRTAVGFCDRADRVIQSPTPEGSSFLLLYGPVGTGKTFLACAVLRRLLLTFGHSGRFVDFQTLLSRLRDTYAKKTPEGSLLGPLQSTDVLVIDELGKGRTENEWQLEKLDELIGARYNERRVTILTTNYLLAGQTYRPPPGGGPVNESFWRETLPSRIGYRLYDRLLEAATPLDFREFPSMRSGRAQAFLSQERKGP